MTVPKTAGRDVDAYTRRRQPRTKMLPLRVAAATAASVLVTIMSANALELNVTYSSGSYTEIMEETARMFEEANPGITLNIRAPFDRHEEHLQRTLRDHALGEVADVAFHGNHLVSLLIERDIVQPVGPLMADGETFESLGYAATVPQVAQRDGTTYGLPWQISVPLVFFNIDLVAQAGGDPDNLPQTWEEIIDLAEAINGLGEDVMGGYFAYQTNGNWTYQALINSRGGRMMDDEETKIAFNDEHGLWALNVISEFGSRAGMVDMSPNQARQAFEAGAIGVYASFSSLLGRFQTAADGQFVLAAGRWPMPAENGFVPTGGRTIVVQATDPDRQQAAWDYMKFMTGPKVQSILVKRIGAVPANLRVIESPDYLADYYAERPAARVGTEMVQFLAGWYSFPGDNAVKIVDEIKEQLRRAATNEAEVETIMADMVETVGPLLPASSQ